VLYLAAEGAGGIQKRIEALLRKYGPTKNSRIINHPVDLFRDYPGGDIEEVIARAEEMKAGLIVVDTVNRALKGADENSSRDMGVFIGNVSKIRKDTGAHIALIHHGTKDGAHSRGHGSLNGMVDLIVEVSKDKDDLDGQRIKFVGQARVSDAKDDDDNVVLGFKTLRVEVGTAKNGKPITTLLVEEMELVDKKESASGKKKAMEILKELIDRDGTPIPPDGRRAVEKKAWKEECAKRGLTKARTEGAEKRAFTRAVKDLNGFIVELNGWVRPSTRGEIENVGM
jgi:hypothetical protein